MAVFEYYEKHPEHMMPDDADWTAWAKSLWQIEVPIREQMMEGPLYARWEYFVRASKSPWKENANDELWALNILGKSIAAEMLNPDTPDYPYTNPEPTERGTTGPMS